MRTHLLIVGQYTYPVHRQRLLTGSGNLKIPFQKLTQDQILALCTDFARVGAGDDIYFYVMKDGALEAQRGTLLRLYQALFHEECTDKRTKVSVINSIKQRLVNQPDAEAALLKAINETEAEDEEFPKKTYRYLLEILGNPEPMLRDGFYGTFTVLEEPYLMQYSQAYEKAKNVYGREIFSGNVINNYLWMRVKVKPKMLFPNPVSEFELLDDFSDEIVSWTLIYRKLFGERSCTAIPPIEEQKILRLIRTKNPALTGVERLEYPALQNRIMTMIQSGGVEFVFEPAWDNDKVEGASPISTYIRNLNNSSGANLLSESLLEANVLYDLTNLANPARSLNPNVKEKLAGVVNYPEEKVIWVGNQVVCSAGNSKSDIVSFHGTPEDITPTSISVFELKNVALTPADVDQVGKYARWFSTTYLQRKIEKVRHILIGWSADGTIDDTVLDKVRSGAFPFPVHVLTYRLENSQIILTDHSNRNVPP